MFKDFFGNEIAIGAWAHLACRSGGVYMRFARIEKIGSTGKPLMRVYNSGGMGWGTVSRLVPCHVPDLLWIMPEASLPPSLLAFIKKEQTK